MNEFLMIQIPAKRKQVEIYEVLMKAPAQLVAVWTNFISIQSKFWLKQKWKWWMQRKFQENLISFENEAQI